MTSIFVKIGVALIELIAVGAYIGLIYGCILLCKKELFSGTGLLLLVLAVVFCAGPVIIKQSREFYSADKNEF